jgi:hypothetical protein
VITPTVCTGTPFASFPHTVTLRSLSCLGHHSLILSTLDVIQGPIEVSLGILQTLLRSAFCIAARKVRVYQLDESVEILRRYLR